jgi:hypothetical protein
MQKYHESAFTLKLRPVVGIPQDQCPTAERDHDRAISESLAVKSMVGCCPHIFLLEIFRGYIVNEDRGSNSINPHEEGRSCIHHGERSHCSDAPQVSLCVVLHGVTRTDINPLDTEMTRHLDHIAADIFACIVTHNAQRDPVATAEIC